jgi:hypothetical protein
MRDAVEFFLRGAVEVDGRAYVQGFLVESAFVVQIRKTVIPGPL